MLAFTLGALLPLLTITLTPASSPHLGDGGRRRRGAGAAPAGCPPGSATAPSGRAVVRNVGGGVLAMAVTYGIGALLGTQVG